MTDSKRTLPEALAAIERSGFVVFADDSLPAAFRARFDTSRIPVVAIRHVRVWGLQVDDERQLPGRERTSIADEELWEVQLRAADGPTYPVDSSLVRRPPG